MTDIIDPFTGAPLAVRAARKPSAYIMIDVESAVIDRSAHARYVAMERPSPEDLAGQNMDRQKLGPILHPRWPFQTIVTASAMVLNVHAEGNVEVGDFETWSAPDLDERGVLEGLFDLVGRTPKGAELCSWGAAMHDIPLIMCAAMKHGLTLPDAWRWMAFGGDGRQKHIDLARLFTSGFKIKPVHQAEYAAALDVPAKMTAAPHMVAKFIKAGAWDLVQEVVEGDVITGALLLARWRKLDDPRAEIDIVEDRIFRRVIELRPERRYAAELRARRGRALANKLIEAAVARQLLAPWLDEAA